MTGSTATRQREQETDSGCVLKKTFASTMGFCKTKSANFKEEYIMPMINTGSYVSRGVREDILLLADYLKNAKKRLIKKAHDLNIFKAPSGEGFMRVTDLMNEYDEQS